jgi:predicted KAP-like P-loop ATPase
MFIYDKPIEKEEDDFLGRARFSRHLGKSLLNWKEKESLIIAIYGEWGSGKSSVINLAKESIEKSDEKDKPTIIEFNPWLFSERDNLIEQFFNEIAKELEIRQDSQRDKNIAKKLKFYASLLSLAPEKKLFKGLFSKIILGLGLLGVSASQIVQWLNIPYHRIKYALFIFGFLLISIEIFKDYLSKFADIFEKKAEYSKKSVLEVKREIKDALTEREKKLVIIIDDIDRLNNKEIKQIFGLIRVNADFSNTIYVLAFDRNIIEKNLEEQKGVSGKDYLNKIVQVGFDIPFARPNKIAAFLFKELDRVLGILPDSAQKFFGQDDPYWGNVYHSGFKDFFKNIRDVKRYASSLEFNISQMYQGQVMEVNPIDFIAIEAIRVFAPDFHSFMKNRNYLFTSTDRDTSARDKNPRKDEIEAALNRLPNDIKESVLELMKRLFPQVDGLFKQGYSTHGHEWQSSWSKKLRVCATDNFDSYFTLIPGGDEEELSQYEIENILNKTNSTDEFEKVLREYIAKKKIRKVLQKIQDYTDDQNLIAQSNAINVVQALFNISDDLPEEKTGMWDIGADMDLMRIIYQILKRESDKNKNYEILKETISPSKGLYGPIQKISLESSRKEKGKDTDEFVVPEDKIEELQKICLEKINSWKDKLLKHNQMLYILYRWKEWDKEDKWREFVNEIIADDEKLIVFLEKFITEIRSQTFGDYGVGRTKKFNYKSLENYEELSNIKSRLEKVQQENSDLYQRKKEVIDLFLENYDKKDSKDLD